MVSHANLLANERMIARAFRVSERSVGGGWVPLFHDLGLIGHVLGALHGGIPAHLMSPTAFLKKPLRWLELISRYRITHSCAPDFAYRLCADRAMDEAKASLDLSCWELALDGAEPVRQDTMDRFVEAFGPCGFRRSAFYPSYGLAEATLFVTGGVAVRDPVLLSARRSALEGGRLVAAEPDTPTGDVRVIVGCGSSPPEQRLVIVNPETRRPVGDGEVGEIWIAGEHVATGYWNLPEASADRFGAALAGTDERVFLRTGDLGLLSGGELFVTGRASDLIIIRGVNHYPQDIELSVERLDDRFLMPCAFSVDIDDQERLVIVQEVRRGFPPGKVDDVASRVREVVAEHHGLEVHALVLVRQGAIPRTSSGKVQRACAGQFVHGALDEVARWVRAIDASVASQSRPAEADAIARDADSVSAWLTQRVAQLLSVEPHEIDVHRNLADYGLDSAASVMLSSELERWLGREVPETISWDYPTIAAVAGFLAERS